MRTLLKYLRPYRRLIVLALLLAAINQSFSMLDPYFFGKILDKFAAHPYEEGHFVTQKVLVNGHWDNQKVWHRDGPRSQAEFIWGVVGYLGILIGVAMVSRIAKAFQDYFSNVIIQQ